MFVGFLVAMMVAALVPALHVVFSSSSEPLGVVLAAAAIFAVGLIDDVRDMSAPAKVAGQVLAASILYFLGVTLYQFKVPLAGFIVLTPGVIPLITALWVIALTNAINLIDGLDGLAAGVVAIGGGALAVYGLRLMDLGVLPTEQRRSPGGGDRLRRVPGVPAVQLPPGQDLHGGRRALFLGLLMSASTMVIGGRTPPASGASGVTYFFFAPLFIPFFILGVPLIDMAFAFIRRTARGTAFHTPDKDHIHHRLLRLGHGHRRSVLILWAWTALLSGFVLFPLFFHRVNAFIPFGAAALGSVSTRCSTRACASSTPRRKPRPPRPAHRGPRRWPARTGSGPEDRGREPVPRATPARDRAGSRAGHPAAHTPRAVAPARSSAAAPDRPSPAVLPSDEVRCDDDGRVNSPSRHAQGRGPPQGRRRRRVRPRDLGIPGCSTSSLPSLTRPG